MPQKGRLPIEEKLKIVEEYLNGEISINACAQRYKLSRATVRSWVELYKARGIKGLIPSEQTRKYSVEIKKRAVEEYQSGWGTQSDICVKYDISNRSMLTRWIERYNSHKDFKHPNSGGEIYMAKGHKTTLEDRIEITSYCIANSKDYGKVIERYSVSYQQIYGWVRKYEESGIDGLVDRRGKRKGKESMSEVERLQGQLKLKEAENLRLQMENELLKKLEALERGRNVD